MKTQQVAMRIAEIFPIPAASAQTVNEFQFFENDCTAFLDYGFGWQFTYPTIGLIANVQAGYVCRFIAPQKAASPFFVNQDRCGIWRRCLKFVGVAIFSGYWHSNVLEFFISCMPNLDVLTCTHIDCSKMAVALNGIVAPKLREITLHVPVAEEKQVVQSLADRGQYIGATVKRIMLVFSRRFSFEFVKNVQRALAPFLTADAQQIVLFGGEENKCVQTLRSSHFYEPYGVMQMACNGIFDDTFAQKLYEKYAVFKMAVEGGSVLIGSRIGKGYVDRQKRDMGRATMSTKCVSSSSLLFVNKSSLEVPYQHPTRQLLHPQQYREARCLNAYPALREQHGILFCCTSYPSGIDDTPLKRFKIPGWSTWRVQKMIVHRDFTEFFTVNGFYIRLDEMQDEPNFYANAVCTKRFYIECTTHLRLRVECENMRNFFANAEHIEFLGDWDSTVLGRFFYQITPTTTALTLVRISFQHGQVLRHLLNNLHGDVNQGLKKLHYDARDSYDESYNSCFNGMRDGLFGLEEVVMVVANLGDDKFGQNLDKVFADTLGLVKEGGSHAIVVTKGTLDMRQVKEIFGSKSCVYMVPLAYLQPSEYYESGSRMRLMHGLYCNSVGRNIHLLFKWDDSFVRSNSSEGLPIRRLNYL